MKIKLFLSFLLFLGLSYIGFTQTNSPSIQSGVTFNWSDTQTNPQDAATIESITVNGTLYYNFGVPSGYELTQLGSGGHNKNNIRLDGTLVESTSASPTWDASALDAYQSLNLNHYFETNGNGQNICDDYAAEETTTAQRQTLSYGEGIVSNSSGLIAVTERNANNCYHLEFFGIPFGGTVEQSLGETFVNQTNTQWGYGGTGWNGNTGTPGAVNPPNPGTDYWLSDRVIENGGTIGIALFYLDDIAPFGSTITKVQLTSATVDDGDGKLFILTFPDDDKDSLSDIDDIDDDNDGILDTVESGGIDPSADHDVDGIPNYQDADFCTLNSSGICANLDLDSDGIPNHFDLDSDNDGLSDVFESGGIDANFDAVADGTIGKTPSDFGVPGSAGTGTIPINTDNTGNYDFLDIDSDDDGIPDNIEAQPTLTYVNPSGMGVSMLDANEDGIDDIYNDHGLYDHIKSISDTDSDGIYDYVDLDSDNDGLPDIEENGMANAVSGNDSDNDGLDNNFETNGINDSLLDVNEAIDNPSDLSTLPDTDGDLFSGGDLDYRDLFNVNPPSSATLDFDGVDDYLTVDRFITGLEEVTVMAWVKADSGSNINKTILGEDVGCRLWLKSGKNPYFSVSVEGQSTKHVGVGSISYNVWHHIAGTYSAATGLIKIYVDGQLKDTHDLESTGNAIRDTGYGNGSFEIGRLSRNAPSHVYFKGDIDEVRVFDSALNDVLIQQMVYQEIEDNGGLVRGKIIPKDIWDENTSQNIPWNNLIAYYPMTDIKNNTTQDYSGNDRILSLRNITTAQEQTAPMPYVTSNDGSWIDTNVWLHGDVWDITKVYENQDWSIVNIKNNVTSTDSHTNLGLIIDPNKTLEITGDNKVENTLYFELNGTLDLLNDSQLVQGIQSDLVTSDAGKIMRRQEGNSSVYWYNYWASPVGMQQTTTLSNNNLNTANTNNSNYRLNMLRKGDGSEVEFTNSYNEIGKVSTRWLYTYKNGVTYYDYAFLNPNTQIEPGVGYTQKGTGTTDSQQQFIFEGKPNNGTITIDVTDTGGNGSVPAVSKTDYLLGNPYASALDIHKFIDANQGVIDGTLHLWQQWSGTSHNLDEYDGGYAQVNKMGSVRAYQFVGIEGATNGNQDGTKTPTKYLPVGQGFMVEIVADGTVLFKNDQRVFIKESDADGSYENGSTFFRVSDDTNDYVALEDENQDSQLIRKVRLEFSSVDGPATRRELLLGFSEFTSDGYDYGYDAKNVDENADDLNLQLEDELMTIQAYDAITPDKTVPLVLHTSGNFNYSIRATQFEDFDENQAIFLKDNITGTYFDLKNEQSYEFSSNEGVFNNRFEIVFQEEVTLSEENYEYQYYLAYFNNSNDKFYVKGLQSDAKQFMVLNILGQSVREYANLKAQELDSGIEISNLSTGTYVIYIKTEDSTITKKIIVN